MQSLTKQKSPWFLDARFVIIALAAVLALALPLLWMTPNFSKKAKFWITVMIVFLTGVSIWMMGSSLEYLNKQLQILKESQAL